MLSQTCCACSHYRHFKPPGACCAAGLMPCFRSLQSLAHLALHMRLYGWNSNAIHALTTGMPYLRALLLIPSFSTSTQTHSVDVSARRAVLDALAHRTGLEALRISVDHLGAGADLRSFSNLLMLKELHVVVYNGADDHVVAAEDHHEAEHLEQLLEAMAVHLTLTKLAVEKLLQNCDPGEVSEPGLRNLLSLPDRPEVLDLAAWLPGSFISSLTTMTRLRAIKLTNVDFVYGPETLTLNWEAKTRAEMRKHWHDVTRLGNLQVLEVADDHADIVKAVLQHASCLTALRELSLASADTDSGAATEQYMLHDSGPVAAQLPAQDADPPDTGRDRCHAAHHRAWTGDDVAPDVLAASGAESLAQVAVRAPAPVHPAAPSQPAEVALGALAG
jgi:hypothetical protein